VRLWGVTFWRRCCRGFSVLGCEALCLAERLQISSWNAWPLKMKALFSSETSVTTNPMTQHHFPEDLNAQACGYLAIYDVWFDEIQHQNNVTLVAGYVTCMRVCARTRSRVSVYLLLVSSQTVLVLKIQAFLGRFFREICVSEALLQWEICVFLYHQRSQHESLWNVLVWTKQIYIINVRSLNVSKVYTAENYQINFLLQPTSAQLIS
jgi:hypothetical protein